MRRRGFTQADAARFLEFEPPYINDLLTERRTPGLANAIRIERRTGISVEAWTPSEIDEHATVAAAGPPKSKRSQGVKG